ncbi:MAG: copper amine oxidase N-terminal domain-containing protein [Oscillospiraceae bacterium]|nr:copper amine oxidase N-terminal domain-containing protein [Oscillospiraceae bacterium]
MRNLIANLGSRKFIWISIAAVVVLGIALASFLMRDNTAARFNEVKPTIEKAIVVFTNSDTTISRGELQTGSLPPFMENGIKFVSINEISSILGADFHMDEVSRIVSIELNSHRVQFMLGFNLIIVNDSPVVIRSKPIERDGHIFMPANLLSELFNVPVFRDYCQGITVVGALKPLSEEEFLVLKGYAGLQVNKPQTVAELDELDIKDIYPFARDERLFVSDDAGQLFKWFLLDDFTLIKETQSTDSSFLPNTVFIQGEGSDKEYLFIADSSDRYSLTPEAKTISNLEYATMRYVEMKMAHDVFGLSEIQEVANMMKLYSSFITGRTTAPLTEEYVHRYGHSSEEILDIKRRMSTYYPELSIPLTADFDYYLLEAIFRIQHEQNLELTGKIDNATYDYIKNITDRRIAIDGDITHQKWMDLCSKARSGDILVFKNNSTGWKYGYFSHAALILNVSTSEGAIHVIQARSFEHGVGADLPIDRITYDKFYSDSYWRNSDTMLLLSAKDMTEDVGIRIAEKAYAHFKEYEFGFGGFFGAKETTCVEIIRDSLRFGDIDLISDLEYLLRLKDALDGAAKSLILLPDDIILSDNIVIVDYWEK